MEKIKFSPKSNIGVGNLHDNVPERMIRVYPNEMPNASKSEEFIGGQTTSIVYISQDGLDTTDEILHTDDAGFKYFDMFAAITSSGVLDISSATSTLGQELKEEDAFTAISNWYYEGELDKIKIGDLKFIPAVFTIGKPLDKDEYESGDQAVFMTPTMIEAKEGRAQYSLKEIDTEGLYEFQLINVTNIEASFTNAKLMFTNVFDASSEDILTFDKTGNGITLGFENHTLINYVKGKGKTEEIRNGNDLGTEFGDLDFTSEKVLAPLMMVPTDVQDKVSMYIPWFDYDITLPFSFAENFKSAGLLSKVITNEDDRHMVEDMLIISAGFAEQWESAPILDSGGDAGKIDPKFRVGWSGKKISTISGKSAIEVVDSIYENHIRKHPKFLKDFARYQPAKAIIVALSRYISSSYAIGKGQNSFNAVFLPWYLEPADNTPIVKTKKEVQVDNPDAGKDGTTIGSYTIADGVEFVIKTNYYRSEYSSSDKLTPTSELLLPKSVNLSNIKMIQTNGKLTLPEIPYTISPITKLNLPGDMDIKSSNDLKYIWYLPIENQTILEEFFLNKESVGTAPVGKDVIVYPFGTKQDPGRGVDGKIWTQAEIDQATLDKQPGVIKTPSTISNTFNTSFAVANGNNVPGGIQGTGWKTDIILSSKKLVYTGSVGIGSSKKITDDELIKMVQIAFGYRDIGSITISNNSLTAHRNEGFDTKNTYYTGSATVMVTHSLASSALVTVTSAVNEKYDYKDRQVQFDKQQWRGFLEKFSIVPNSVLDYNLLENSNFKIKQLDEIIIGSCWGNFVEIKINGRIVAKVELFNSTDESIGVQRIIFT